MTAIEVVRPGMLTTVQDWPGRTGYWHVGVPPSGPMDDLSFPIGNRVLGNPQINPPDSNAQEAVRRWRFRTADACASLARPWG